MVSGQKKGPEGKPGRCGARKGDGRTAGGGKAVRAGRSQRIAGVTPYSPGVPVSADMLSAGASDSQRGMKTPAGFPSVRVRRPSDAVPPFGWGPGPGPGPKMRVNQKPGHRGDRLHENQPLFGYGGLFRTGGYKSGMIRSMARKTSMVRRMPVTRPSSSTGRELTWWVTSRCTACNNG